MRKIEEKMMEALRTRTPMNMGNTRVDSEGRVYLHGNHIANYAEDGMVEVNEYTLAKWPTPTTKSRLRAMGANATTRQGVTYLDGRPV